MERLFEDEKSDARLFARPRSFSDARELNF
jgi:hypothetical protein